MKKVALAEIKDQLSKFLRQAEQDEIVITRHGRPAGVLIGFRSDEDWFEYQLEKDPRFLSRIDAARRSVREGHGVRLDDLPREGGRRLTRRSSGPARKRASRAKR